VKVRHSYKINQDINFFKKMCDNIYRYKFVDLGQRCQLQGSIPGWCLERKKAPTKSWGSEPLYMGFGTKEKEQRKRMAGKDNPG